MKRLSFEIETINNKLTVEYLIRTALSKFAVLSTKKGNVRNGTNRSF